MAVDLEGLLLQALAESPDAVIPDSQTWAQSHNLDPQAVVGALKSLLTDAYVTTEDLATSFLEFTKEAQQVVENGSPEFLVFAAIQNAGGLAMPDLQAAVGKDVAKIGMGNAMKAKWIAKDGATLKAAAESVTDEVQQQLQTIKEKAFAMDALDAKVCLDHVASTRVYLPCLP